MALINNELSVWEISFRWDGYDPDKFWLRIPLPVRDRLRTLMDAILNCRLECETMSMDKYNPKDGLPPQYFIRHYLPQIESCIYGQKYDRKLFKWAHIDRYTLQLWCERQGAPKPEFWFPLGWKEEFEWDSDVEKAQISADAPASETQAEKKIRIDKRHRTQMACEQLAIFIWEREPKLTINVVANRPEVQKWAGGSEYKIETVEGWISKHDPRSSSEKTGPKPKNN